MHSRALPPSMASSLQLALILEMLKKQPTGIPSLSVETPSPPSHHTVTTAGAASSQRGAILQRTMNFASVVMRLALLHPPSVTFHSSTSCIHPLNSLLTPFSMSTPLDQSGVHVAGQICRVALEPNTNDNANLSIIHTFHLPLSIFLSPLSLPPLSSPLSSLLLPSSSIHHSFTHLLTIHSSFFSHPPNTRIQLHFSHPIPHSIGEYIYLIRFYR